MPLSILPSRGLHSYHVTSQTSHVLSLPIPSHKTRQTRQTPSGVKPRPPCIQSLLFPLIPPAYSKKSESLPRSPLHRLVAAFPSQPTTYPASLLLVSFTPSYSTDRW